jgi:DNA polymerase-2
MTTHPHSGFILTRTMRESRNRTYVDIWLSTDHGPINVISESQPFVLFIPNQELKEAEEALKNEHITFQTKSLTLKDFSGNAVNGVYFSTARIFYIARECLKQRQITTYEDDIRLSERFLMERFIYASTCFKGTLDSNFPYPVYHDTKLKPDVYQPNFKVLSLDIECGKGLELYSVGLAAENFEAVIMIGEPESGPKYIHWVKNEKQLLIKMVEIINQYDPDIFIGWSVVQFDFKTLIKRAKIQNVPLTLSRDGTAIQWKEGKSRGAQGYVVMAGRLIVDGIDALKTATYQFESFSLENVSQTLLGKGKAIESVANRFAHIQHDFLHNKIKLAHYNLQDCLLVIEIFAKTNLLDFLTLRSQLTGLELDRSGGSVAAFINLYLPKLHRAGYVSPNRPDNGGLASPGGYVMSSRPGLYKNILVLDFKSLYPSIIRTFKIDPLGLIEGLRQPDKGIEGFKGAYFDRDKHFLPDIINSLWEQRDQAKKNNDNARSQAIKILMNSFYGVLGSGGCPFYDTRLASSITMRGHDIMQTTAQWITQQGHQVIYGDTDSTFVWIGDNVDGSQAKKIGEDLTNLINQKWTQKIQSEFQTPSFLEIEFETHFEKFLMPTIRGSELGSKKRYCGVKRVNNVPQMVFKGLETVRSDWTPLAKEFQQALYEMVFNERDVTDYIITLLQEIREGQHDSKLIYRKQIRQPLEQYTKNVPPHVKAARFADHKNIEQGLPLQYQNRGWINYIITINGPEPCDFMQSAYDYEHYIEKQIKPIAEGILPFIGVSFEETTSKQLGLF